VRSGEDAVSRTASTTVNSDAVNAADTRSSDNNGVTSATAERRLPFSNSVASTVRSSDKSRTASTTASDSERSRTVDRTNEELTTDAVAIQNGLEAPPPPAGACNPSIPLQLSSSSSSSLPGATLSADVSSLSQRREVENCVAQWTTTTGPPSTEHLTAAPAADNGWYYCDPQGLIQGMCL